MPEPGFQDQNLSLRSSLRPRDASPDSVIFTLESNFSVFSSASASVDRCSFASDGHDQDSLVSEISQHLAGHDVCESSSGPDLDPNKSTVHKSSRLTRKAEKTKGYGGETEDEAYPQDSARSSFSQAIKECRERRSRSEAVSKKPDRRRPASLDLNNATTSSPRLGVMKKSSVSSRHPGTFPSPGTPNYRHNSVGVQKGWSSERVPSHTHTNRRQVSAALLPFNNGRTLPSKWEDAERWIFSPVSGDGGIRPALPPPHRRPKAKSGPLGPPGIAYYSLYSPVVSMFEGGNVGNFMPSSPFSAGVMTADGLAVPFDGRGVAVSAQTEPCMARSASVHGCTEVLGQSSLLDSLDENLDSIKDAATNISFSVSRRDMATQMSPESSTHSSPKRRPSFTPTLSVTPIPEGAHSSRLEVRDVQVDERVTVTRWSKKHKGRIPGKSSENVDDWKKKAVGAQSSTWELSETAKSISKVKREEAKITAWENLQKAKAEAAIRKLEMKLEKKRSSSMDKIMNKLRSAQKKAQEMRSSVLVNQAHQVVKTSHKALSFRRTRHMGSLSGCFTCHAF
ncbi:uncharacterized protein LOC131161890 [Malania oleifera]|uniref:uncharacterized protein LOC131161890 n=1 Tax=Malania oleifera TaxID=397392 RepID=UPI0025AEA7F1|nr:uncharacterized protein LOC131161890 [Malania oleifera]XP_057973889.1 uncharacterized protein LOC131161890 [Malania oleifera]XP_057973890.1 uncharacterized protein LOC131161890 [Malania oleifera]XP_057973891.1 uncharacterized protein LOC131161890 [Malania oleifera]